MTVLQTGYKIKQSLRLFTELKVRYLLLYLVEGMGLSIIVGLLFFNNFIGVFTMLPLVLPFLIFRVKGKKKEEDNGLLKAFSDGILAVMVGLNAGYSVENAFVGAIPELELIYGNSSRVVRDFRRIAHEISINKNIEDVLYDYAALTQLEDIMCFAQVFKIAKRRGGDINSVIRNTIDSIREKQDTIRQIQTVISAKRTESIIMSFIPLLIIGYLRVTASDLICKMYGNTMGIMVMSICLAVYVLSVFVAIKIVDIRV